MAEIRVVLVDEHVMIREALAEQLGRERDITVIAQFDHGAGLMQYLAERTGPIPHIVLVAVWRHRSGGLHLTERLAKQSRNIRVIGLVDARDVPTMVQMHHAGAYGCVPKARTLPHLLETIRAARYGGDHVDPMTEQVVSAFKQRQDAYPTRTGLPADHPLEQISLTKREFAVLEYACNACSNHEIAIHLGISNRTVQTHLTHIYTKMKVRGRMEAVIKAVHNRWIFPYLLDDIE